MNLKNTIVNNRATLLPKIVTIDIINKNVIIKFLLFSFFTYKRATEVKIIAVYEGFKSRKTIFISKIMK